MATPSGSQARPNASRAAWMARPRLSPAVVPANRSIQPPHRMGRESGVGSCESEVVTNRLSDFRLSSPSHLDDFEGFAELERLPLGQLFGAVPHTRLQFCSVADLRYVRAQRIDLAIERCGNIDDFVRVLRTKEPDLGGLVRLESLLEMLGEIEGIARGRVDGIRRSQTDGAVIGMERIRAKWIVRDDHVRLMCPDHAHDLLAQVEIRHERAIWATQKDDLVHVEPAGRLDHFRLSRPGNLDRIGCGVRATPVARGHLDEHNSLAGVL